MKFPVDFAEERRFDLKCLLIRSLCFDPSIDRFFREHLREKITEYFQETETIPFTEWDEDSDDLKNRFPKLVEKYANQSQEEAY